MHDMLSLNNRYMGVVVYLAYIADSNYLELWLKYTTLNSFTHAFRVKIEISESDVASRIIYYDTSHTLLQKVKELTIILGVLLSVALSSVLIVYLSWISVAEWFVNPGFFQYYDSRMHNLNLIYTFEGSIAWLITYAEDKVAAYYICKNILSLLFQKIIRTIQIIWKTY